ncbi:hypothetical protein EDEG_02040 [Edhazardia aedis USNM 41457]|uniref:Uncharacterized protein n=1 Tax=Edhazardia aedis (strain USNM 41457) TaxID=1003232 RepID=J8ZVH4_EDHAE|nr:hypothetical protein EDEG_02040 [Edhazardia aedis USNM 41457]|eukprot:EJW03643.1 hypothetical protein EDEG_02040 [Edhazardia aedis USNM 41457]
MITSEIKPKDESQTYENAEENEFLLQSNPKKLIENFASTYFEPITNSSSNKMHNVFVVKKVRANRVEENKPQTFDLELIDGCGCVFRLFNVPIEFENKHNIPSIESVFPNALVVYPRTELHSNNSTNTSNSGVLSRENNEQNIENNSTLTQNPKNPTTNNSDSYCSHCEIGRESCFHTSELPEKQEEFIDYFAKLHDKYAANISNTQQTFEIDSTKTDTETFHNKRPAILLDSDTIINMFYENNNKLNFKIHDILVDLLLENFFKILEIITNLDSHVQNVEIFKTQLARKKCETSKNQFELYPADFSQNNPRKEEKNTIKMDLHTLNSIFSPENNYLFCETKKIISHESKIQPPILYALLRFLMYDQIDPLLNISFENETLIDFIFSFEFKIYNQVLLQNFLKKVTNDIFYKNAVKKIATKVFNDTSSSGLILTRRPEEICDQQSVKIYNELLNRFTQKISALLTYEYMISVFYGKNDSNRTNSNITSINKIIPEKARILKNGYDFIINHYLSTYHTNFFFPVNYQSHNSYSEEGKIKIINNLIIEKTSNTEDTFSITTIHYLLIKTTQEIKEIIANIDEKLLTEKSIRDFKQKTNYQIHFLKELFLKIYNINPHFYIEESLNILLNEYTDYLPILTSIFYQKHIFSEKNPQPRTAKDDYCDVKSIRSFLKNLEILLPEIRQTCLLSLNLNYSEDAHSVKNYWNSCHPSIKYDFIRSYILFLLNLKPDQLPNFLVNRCINPLYIDGINNCETCTVDYEQYFNIYEYLTYLFSLPSEILLHIASLQLGTHPKIENIYKERFRHPIIFFESLLQKYLDNLKQFHNEEYLENFYYTYKTITEYGVYCYGIKKN